MVLSAEQHNNNPDASPCWDQLVAWITPYYNPIIYLGAVDPCLANTISSHSGSPLSRVALIDSLLDWLILEDCLAIAEIEYYPLVEFVTINKMDMVDDTHMAIHYMTINPL